VRHVRKPFPLHPALALHRARVRACLLAGPFPLASRSTGRCRARCHSRGGQRCRTARGGGDGREGRDLLLELLQVGAHEGARWVHEVGGADQRRGQPLALADQRLSIRLTSFDQSAGALGPPHAGVGQPSGAAVLRGRGVRAVPRGPHGRIGGGTQHRDRARVPEVKEQRLAAVSDLRVRRRH
jgi:hypothetical protein